MKRLLLIIWGGIAGAAIAATLAHSQATPPEPSPLLTACAYAGALAEQSGVAMTRCRLIGIGQVNPNAAIVTVQAKINGQGLFQVKVWLYRSEWSPQTVQIVPEVR